MESRMKVLRVMIIIWVIVLIVGGLLATSANAQDVTAENCDLSGAAYVEVVRYGNRAGAGQSSDADTMLAPSTWAGATTWIGGGDGHLTLAHEYAERYAWVTYVTVETITEIDDNGQPTGRAWEVREPLHHIEIRANKNYFYVFIMPNDQRENATDWHGCASFAVPRDGEIEVWLAEFEVQEAAT